jgi:hypothetical protein
VVLRVGLPVREKSGTTSFWSAVISGRENSDLRLTRL